MKFINAVGLDCPRPVIMAKKAIENENLSKLTIAVDNEIATENLSKLAKSLGFNVVINQKTEFDYEVTFTNDNNQSSSIVVEEPIKATVESDYIVVVDSNEMGKGDSDFSKNLLVNFIYALREQDTMPRAVIMYNLGVELATINDKTVEDLQFLDAEGVEILCCGLCLEKYNVKEKLQVGSPTNMYKICEMMTSYRVVKPC